jgi:tight adherence protein C
MTPSVHGIAAMAGMGVAFGAACVLMGNVVREAATVARPRTQVPWFIRVFWMPGAIIAPAVAPFLAERWSGRIERSLGAVELEAALTPDTWIAVRLAHGITAAASGVVGALLLQVATFPAALVGFALGFSLGGLWMRKARRELERRITRDLPSYLDLLTVCVEAGATLTAGIRRIVEQAPDSPLRRYFEHVLREVHSGRLRAEAFESVAQLYAVPSLSTLAATLAHAESSGMSLGGILRAQGQQQTAERFARAEKLAMQAPVKLLGPLILCIFPCTFIVLAVPIVVRLSQALTS